MDISSNYLSIGARSKMPTDEILGQDSVLGALSVIMQKGMIPPFILLTGPCGVGKKKAALRFAKALHCAAKPKDLTVCDACDDCTKVSRGTHPGVVIVDLDYQQAVLSGKTSVRQLKIETMRHLMDTVKGRPFGGKPVVVIIDDADTLTLQAQNAMLKILEEAPAHLSWLWIVESEEFLLPTIVSCASFKLPLRRLHTGLLERIVMERRGCTQAEAQAAALAGFGSAQAALAYHDSAKLGKVRGPWPRPLDNPREIMSAGMKVARYKSHSFARKDAAEFIEGLKRASVLDGQVDAVVRTRSLGYILHAQRDLEANITPALVFERLLLKLCAIT